MDLTTLFSKEVVSKAIAKLKGKKFKKSFVDLKRFTRKEEKQTTSFYKYLDKLNIDEYLDSLKSYELAPFKGLRIEKSNNKYRPLLIPQHKDRVVFAASFPIIRDLISPKLKIYNALGLGLSKRTRTSRYSNEVRNVLREIAASINSGKYDFIVKLDFKDFFSTIDRDLLQSNLQPYFKSEKENKLLELVYASFNNRIEADPQFWGTFGDLKLKKLGIPQGLAYSPLLASFYATQLDEAVYNIRRIKSYRYLDDMIILAADAESSHEAYEHIKEESEKMKLKLHPLEEDSKTQIINIKERNFDFLGITISQDGLIISEKAGKKFKSIFESEIFNNSLIETQEFQEIKDVYANYGRGWAKYYQYMCPDDFERIRHDINQYLIDYINKHKKRKKFMGQKIFVLPPPNIYKIVSKRWDTQKLKQRD